ncbi:poly(A) polymerase I [Legionella londiniensis]|uniref:Poly(A) polymerase I n=1 Tax=Legionella londiniensis TaxID=45068 RepID=A0A0W0VLR4_9GAMM|nr:poly(A) polymerase I [Legionella londiniensis]STX93115.1 poly(A) polymerase I [Legionella londiniensis]
MATIIKFIKKLLRNNKASHPSIHSDYIIPRSEHHISRTDISANALKVLNRLTSAGFEAYLVGGSVRDLLLRKMPKDFDIATNATPNQIKNLFRNARIIGRRFKLVHVLFHREIIEVATFRGHEATLHTDQLVNDQGMLIRDNVYGTLEEDAWRRDFTINSLYYNIEDGSIIDYTGGVEDIKNRLIRIIGNPEKRYQEDPVRMLRAIRFCAKLHFEPAPDTAKYLRLNSHLITHVSGSRLFDEMTKFYQCGEAESAHRLLVDYGLFDLLFPNTHQVIKDYPVNALLGIALENTDSRVRDNKPVTPAFLFAILLWFPLLDCAKKLRQSGMEPLPALEKAMSLVISQQNQIITIPKRYSQVIREMWIMQYRFPRRTGKRAFTILQHPRFRAAYDFLALRALAGDESMELAEWWTAFQEADNNTQQEMVAALSVNKPRRKRRRRKPSSP